MFISGTSLRLPKTKAIWEILSLQSIIGLVEDKNLWPQANENNRIDRQLMGSGLLTVFPDVLLMSTYSEDQVKRKKLDCEQKAFFFHK